MPIPLLEELTAGPIPAGSNILVEFDPSSIWYNACLTIATKWLQTGGKLVYNVGSQLPENIRAHLNRLGVTTEELEQKDVLRLWDWYTITLGGKSKEKFAMESLKVADISILFAKDQMRAAVDPTLLRVGDNASTLARFNDDKAWVEFFLTRSFPTSTLRKSTLIIGVIRGVHSDWVYKMLEGGADGIVDFKLEESGSTTKDLIRIRSMRNLSFNREWHELKMSDNFEVTLAK
jgi:KaiC/GvpD/RAD55 family RecA-like ATPase